MGKFNTFIFDLDGTLVHTAPEFRYILVGQTLTDLGIPIPENRVIDQFWFEAGRDHFVQEHFGVEPQKFWAVYSKYDTIELRKQFMKPYSDVNFVQELNEKRYKTGIVTNAPPHIILLETGIIGRENYHAIVSTSSGKDIPPKPHPLGLERCLGMLKSKREEAVYVGNADEDVNMARNARFLTFCCFGGNMNSRN